MIKSGNENYEFTVTIRSFVIVLWTVITKSHLIIDLKIHKTKLYLIGNTCEW